MLVLVARACAPTVPPVLTSPTTPLAPPPSPPPYPQVRREASELQAAEVEGSQSLRSLTAARHTTATIELLDTRVAELTQRLAAANESAVAMAQRAEEAEGEVEAVRGRLAELETRDAGWDAELARATSTAALEAQQRLEEGLAKRATALEKWINQVVDTALLAEPSDDGDGSEPGGDGGGSDVGSEWSGLRDVRRAKDAAQREARHELAHGLAAATLSHTALLQRCVKRCGGACAVCWATGYSSMRVWVSLRCSERVALRGLTHRCVRVRV